MQKVIRTIIPKKERIMFPYFLMSILIFFIVLIAVQFFLTQAKVSDISVAISIVLGLIAGGVSYYEYNTRFSKHRWVLLESGILVEKEDTKHHTIDSIVSLKLKQNLLDRMFNTGKIYINNKTILTGVADYHAEFDFLKDHIHKNRNL